MYIADSFSLIVATMMGGTYLDGEIPIEENFPYKCYWESTCKATVGQRRDQGRGFVLGEFFSSVDSLISSAIKDESSNAAMCEECCSSRKLRCFLQIVSLFINEE